MYCVLGGDRVVADSDLYECINAGLFDEELHVGNRVFFGVWNMVRCTFAMQVLFQGKSLSLREHIDRSINISEKEKIFGIAGKPHLSFQINMFIICTKLTIYQRRPDGQKCRLPDILRIIKNEMLADKHESILNQKMGNFNLKWGGYEHIIG